MEGKQPLKSLTIKPHEVLQRVRDHFLQFMGTRGPPEPEQRPWLKKELDHHKFTGSYSSLTLPFSRNDITTALTDTKASTAPGKDGLSASLLKIAVKHAPKDETALLSLLTCISQAIYDSKGAHSVAKPILVKPIYKSQGSKDLSNLRPIALQNSLAKLPSKILATRLTDALHRNGALHHANEGFLRHKSTGNAIGTILSAFEDAVQFNKPLFGASLDIAKAYDSIRWFTIKNGMDRINLPQEFQDYAMGKMVNTGSTMEIRTRYGLPRPL